MEQHYVGWGERRIVVGLCDFEMRLKGRLRDCSTNDSIRHNGKQIQICLKNIISGSSYCKPIEAYKVCWRGATEFNLFVNKTL